MHHESSRACRKCGHRCRVITSRRVGLEQEQRLECSCCHARRKRVVPATEIWSRKR
jgi:hypothetical protein